MTDVLQQLRDIHPPPAPSWWPPAPGWWLLWLVLLVVVAWSATRWQRRRARAAPFVAASDELERIAGLQLSASERAQQLALLLRRLQLALANARGASTLTTLPEAPGDTAFGAPVEPLPLLLFGVDAPQLRAALAQRFDPAAAPDIDAAVVELRALLATQSRTQ